jgi:hypothetical protein
MRFCDEATVLCPHCGEANVIALDRSGARVQAYEEDCQVCCRPWQVRVRFSDDGEAAVEIEKL